MTKKFSAFFMLGVLCFVVAFQIFIVLIFYPGIFCAGGNQHVCRNMPSSNFNYHWPKNVPEIIYNQSTLEILLRTPENMTKVIPTKSEFDFLLRLRKLVLFSVREVNLRIREEECAHWWVNPLYVSEVKEVNVSRDVTLYQLTFEIQPGKIPFSTLVKVSQGWRNGRGLGFEPEELVFVEGRRLDALPKSCGTVLSSLRRVCLCLEEIVEAEVATKEARKEWEVNDPEHKSWPPNFSMMIPDYITFGRMDIYLNSPGRKAEFCGPDIKMILFVSTRPHKFEVREAIRETYGNPQFLQGQGVKVLFAFDRVTNKALQDKIDEESVTHDDIVQGSHDHAYHNPTFRDLSMFNWIVTHCRLKGSPMPQWFMKTDDDYFINIPFALKVAAANQNIELMGFLSCGQTVLRDEVIYMTKYYTPRYIHAPEFYTSYLSGATWLIRSDVLPLLLKASLTTPFMPVDDVYITGMLTREVGIFPRHLGDRMTFLREAGPCSTKKINSNTMNVTDIFLHWEYFRQPIPSGCNLTNAAMMKVDNRTPAQMPHCLF